MQIDNEDKRMKNLLCGNTHGVHAMRPHYQYEVESLIFL